MVKIELELPEWTNERSIYIFAGIELVAKRIGSDGKWQIKTSRCDMCGKCCMNLKSHIYPIINGNCIHLKKEVGNNPRWLCGLGMSRPFGCCIATPSNQRGLDCNIKFEVVD